jgi:hypothetical protein
MRSSWLAWGLGVVLVSACHKPPPSPTLEIDAAHDVMRSEASPAYEIGACRSITLAGMGFHAESPNSDGATKPTVVHLVHGHDYYRAKWTASGLVTLSAETLEVVRGGAFQSFAPGDPYVVAIGTDGSSLEELHFSPMWTAQIRVR